ncbi:MAG TPA: AAA family ATPase, partial [Marmoricola sp.]|nr:AAA family ATPase [Marmoricola sp.]
NDGVLSTRQAANTIRLAIERIPQIWTHGHVSLGELWKLICTYPYMPRLKDRKVLDDGVLDMPLLWQTDAFALASGYDEAAGRYLGLWVPDGRGLAPAVTDSMLLVQPRAAMRQIASETEQIRSAQLDPSAATDPNAGVGFSAHPEHPGVFVRKTKNRYFGAKELNTDRYVVDFKSAADEVIAHLIASGAKVTVRVEIEADLPSGFDDAQVRTVTENASTLKFDQSGFEES